VRISDTDYRWKSKGTGSKVVVRRHRELLPIYKTQPHLSLSLARKQRHQRDCRTIPQPHQKEHIQKISRYEPGNLPSRIQRCGSRFANVHPCVEGKAEREIEEYGYGVSGLYFGADNRLG